MRYFFVFLCFVVASHAVYAQDNEAASLYNMRCAGCHGQNGDTVNMRMQVAINTLSKDDILVRLALAAEEEPKSAGDRVKASLTPEEADAIANYISEK